MSDDNSVYQQDMADLADPSEGSQSPAAPEEDTTVIAEPESEEAPETATETEEEEAPETKPKEEEKEKAEGPVRFHPRPSVQAIQTKYPQFFKDFPDMRHVLFREGEYSNIFPTVDDAKDAHERSQSFDTFSGLLRSGEAKDFSEFLKGVREAGDDVLSNMAVNFLPSLHAADRDLYFQVTTPIAASLANKAFIAGRNSGNENLANAALHLAQWALGDSRYASGEITLEPPKKASSQDPKFQQEREAFYTERYNEARQFVNDTAMTRLRSEVKKGLDPNNVFNDFTTNLLVDRVIAEVGDQLESDQRHMRTMTSLWHQARRAGFGGNWKERILSTYLSGARSLMPDIRAQIRSKALTQAQAQSERRASGVNRTEVKGSGTPVNGGVKKYGSKDIDWSRTSDLDILNGKPTLKSNK